MPVDGGSLVDGLRALDTTDLSDGQRRAFDQAVENLDAMLEAWTAPAPSHHASSGWTTREVAASVSAICTVDVPSVSFAE